MPLAIARVANKFYPKQMLNSVCVFHSDRITNDRHSYAARTMCHPTEWHQLKGIDQFCQQLLHSWERRI